MLAFYCFKCKLYTAIVCICWMLQYRLYYRFVRNIDFTLLKVAEPFLHSGIQASVSWRNWFMSTLLKIGTIYFNSNWEINIPEEVTVMCVD